MKTARAAVEEGIVPGGGVALLRAVKALENVKLTGDEQIGVDIVRRSVEEPVRQIVGNAGFEGAIAIEKIRGNSDSHFGFNAASPQYEDLVKSGVIDPTKVTRSALQNTSSIAALLLTTEAMIVEIPEKESRSGTRRPARPRHGLLRRSRAGQGGSAAEAVRFRRSNRPPLRGGLLVFWPTQPPRHPNLFRPSRLKRAKTRVATQSKKSRVLSVFA